MLSKTNILYPLYTHQIRSYHITFIYTRLIILMLRINEKGKKIHTPTWYRFLKVSYLRFSLEKESLWILFMERRNSKMKSEFVFLLFKETCKQLIEDPNLSIFIRKKISNIQNYVIIFFRFWRSYDNLFVR